MWLSSKNNSILFVHRETRDKGLKFADLRFLYMCYQSLTSNRLTIPSQWMANVNVSPPLSPNRPSSFVFVSLPDCDSVDNWWWGTGGSRGCVNVLQGGWDAIGSTLAIQPVRRWCRARGVFRADSAETFTGTLPRWPSTSKCIATRLHASSATPLSVVEPTCGVTCVWNTKYTTLGKKSTGSAARKANWTHRHIAASHTLFYLSRL